MNKEWHVISWGKDEPLPESVKNYFDGGIELSQCPICGDHHEPGDIPRECETGDGV